MCSHLNRFKVTLCTLKGKNIPIVLPRGTCLRFRLCCFIDRACTSIMTFDYRTKSPAGTGNIEHEKSRRLIALCALSLLLYAMQPEISYFFQLDMKLLYHNSTMPLPTHLFEGVWKKNERRETRAITSWRKTFNLVV